MSYDISFKVKVEGVDFYVTVWDSSANITWNVREIITRSTGLEWINTENNGLCTNVIPKIASGYEELINNPDKYKPYEATNRWGTVDSVRGFFRQILCDWDAFGIAYPELVDIATFWVE